jgi:hypothetical protein
VDSWRLENGAAARCGRDGTGLSLLSGRSIAAGDTHPVAVEIVVDRDAADSRDCAVDL